MNVDEYPPDYLGHCRQCGKGRLLNAAGLCAYCAKRPVKKKESLCGPSTTRPATATTRSN